MIFQNIQNNFDYKGVKQINESVINNMYNAQSDKRGELFMLEDALLNKTISKEDQELILEFYCKTPITSSEEDLKYPKLKAQMWKAYNDFGKNSKVFKTTKREFESLDLKLTPVGRQYAIESMVENKEVTFFKDLYSNAPKHTTISKVLEDIKNEEHKALIKEIRNSESKEEKNTLKKKLPVVLFNGLFYKRHGDRFIKFSKYMCLDFDDFNSIEDVEKTKERLIEDPYVYAVFKSPKGFGLKVLIKVERKNTIEHLQYFEGAKAHFSSIDGFDDACKDIARSCFMSSDPDLYINTKAEVFTKKLEVSAGNEKLSASKQEKSKQKLIILENDIEKERSIFDETNLDKITKLVYKYWESKYSLAEGNRNNNLYKLAIKLYSAGVPEADITTLFYERFKGVFESDEELDSIVSSACKNESIFNSKPWQNYELKRKVIALLENENDLNELLSENKIDNNNLMVQKELDDLKSENQVFWEVIIDKERRITGYKINEFRVIKFLKSANIFCLNTGGSFQYYEIKNNLIYELNIFDIKNFIVNYIRKTQIGNELLISTFLKQKALYSDLFLSDLKIEGFERQRDTSEDVYKYFLNGVLVISKHKQNQFINYSELENPVYASQIIQHKYLEKAEGKSDFETFIADIADGNIDSFRSALGYLCSNYKSQSNAKAVILSDNSTSFQEANGGRGKSLISKAISMFSNVVRIDGKRYSAQDGFALAPVKHTNEVVFIDDLKQGFHFTDMYNLISDDFEITKKYSDKEIIPFKLAPKILLSSNYPIKGSDESSKRRRFDLVLSDFYSTKYSPVDKFGREFFTSWKETDWNNYYHYMTGCVELFLEKGLIDMSTDSMKMKSLIADTSEDFMSFMDDNLESLQIEFFRLETIKHQYYQHSNHNLSSRRLKGWITKWCDYYDYKLIDNRVNNKRVYKLSKQVILMMSNYNKLVA